MARRRKKRLKKNLIKLFIFAFVVVGVFIAFDKLAPEKSHGNIDNNQQSQKTKPEEKTKTYKISLLATGDGLIHNRLALYAKQKDGSYDFSGYLSEIKDIVSNYDIVYYNQETPFGTKESEYSYYPNFSVPTEYGDAMLDAGFNLVSLASNHSYDKGENGVLRSLNYWNNKENVIYTGMSSSSEERTNYKIGEANNIKYAMLSYTYGLNAESRVKELKNNNKEYLVNVFDYDLASKDIEALRDKVDVLIVAMHWGNEYQLEPTATQKEQAKWLAEHGVDIVIGNHSHCLEPIEWIDNTLVIYSLGNFISNQGILTGAWYKYNGTVKGSIGAFAMLDITKTVEDDKVDIKLDNLKVDLLYTYCNTQDKFYKVLPFSKIDEDYLKIYPNKSSDTWYIKDYKKVHEMYSDIIKKYDKTINVLPYKG